MALISCEGLTSKGRDLRLYILHFADLGVQFQLDRVGCLDPPGNIAAVNPSSVFGLCRLSAVVFVEVGNGLIQQTDQLRVDGRVIINLG